MSLSGAERARLYRQRKKQNDHEYAEYLRNERERYHKRREKGEIRLISDMSEREKRLTRRNWRVRKQRERRKQKTVDTLDTPPSTPSGPFPIQMNNGGRKRMRKDRAKAYREVEKLKRKLVKQQRLTEKYRKRLYRHSEKKKNLNSPRTRTRLELKGQKVNEQTKRTLLFHKVLLQGIREKYQKTKSDKTKQILSKAVHSSLLKKYRMKMIARRQLNLTQRRLNKESTDAMEYSRKPKRLTVIRKMKTDIETFLCRGDNSRVKAGKKSTKTKTKEKKQIHLLNGTLKNLHLKYLAEDTTRKMSYALFCQLKPFYIRHATHRDRETCLCKRHENVQFKVGKLKQLKIIQDTDLTDLASKITCRNDAKKCMYRQCEICCDKNIELGEFTPGEMVEWHEWKTTKIEKLKSSGNGTETKLVTVTAKKKVKGTTQQLVDEFQEELSKCCKHLYNISHQFKAVRDLKQKLTETDVLLHIDFSENIGCKYATEIQSMHFGASQRQISLHTGVIYRYNSTTSFCSISDNLKHSPSGIWGHMKPVLTFVKENFPTATNLFVLSDGPTTQYRCKENFYLMTKIPIDMGFTSVNWSFTEAGHGKGAPDGIGAVIKREADRAVLQGADVTDADTLLKTLESSGIKVKLFLVQDKDINDIDNSLQSISVKPVPGTMKIHQVYSSTSGEIYQRAVSCFCSAPRTCEYYEPQRAVLATEKQISDTVQSYQPPEHHDQTDLVVPLEKPEIDESVKSKYCVVLYDDKPYPGVIVDTDEEEVEVQVMHSIGKNRFFWPLIDDVLWYKKEHFDIN